MGNDSKSDGKLFYIPNTRSLIGSSDFTLDPAPPSGPCFDLPYDGGINFNLLAPDDNALRPPTFDINTSVYVQSPTTHEFHDATIIDIPLGGSHMFTVHYTDTEDIEQVHRDCIHDLSPESPAAPSWQTSPFPSVPWITHTSTKVTMFLPNKMTSPKQGYLLQDSSGQWAFVPGRKTSSRHKGIPLPSFSSTLQSFIADKQLFPGWINKKRVMDQVALHHASLITARRIQFCGSSTLEDISDSATATYVTNFFARHVSASNLHHPAPPRNLRSHHTLIASDKDIWDQAYMEEYLGLHDKTKTWEYISEKQYQALRPVIGNALPSMAISTIKRDEHGAPCRAKYRIVVLGNFDQHHWTTTDCFAPVMSQMEMRLLLAIAVQHRCLPKSGDFVQAFCQSFLPDDEQYICRPPPGCPITPPNTYLLLKRTLYGLKRSPKHWFDKATAAFTSLGLKPCANAPCLFTGTIVPGRPPLYVGLYVDDFLYFSEDPEVEATFEHGLSHDLNMGVDFDHDPQHFLGLKMECCRHADNHVDIFLSQEAFIDSLLITHGLDTSTSTPRTPYRSGYPVDKIPMDTNLPPDVLQHSQALLRTIVGSLNWLGVSTRPDIATITNLLAHYMHSSTPSHVAAAKHVLRYLKGTSHMGISFSSREDSRAAAYVKFPIPPSTIVPLTDANWGPQDASLPNPSRTYEDLDLFKSRSLSGFIIWLGGPLHWVSKRQSCTARSSAEAEIIATDECLKWLQHISHILDDLHLKEKFFPHNLPIYNDNNACVIWSKGKTTKGLRHIQMRENSIRELQAVDFVDVRHIRGDRNLSDMYTKEDKDDNHFIECRDATMAYPPFFNT